ncbi:hypothetical protein [Turicimonas muris]|uniref:hypothetical protein n=1 Tax=Turicimonas muris TaxID=1796652 RepID=UPI0023F0ADC1|nr:hypothetical protein [Turicimonas muris]
MELQFKPEFLATFDEKLREHGYASTAIANSINEHLKSISVDEISSAFQSGYLYLGFVTVIGLYTKNPSGSIEIPEIRKENCTNWSEYFRSRFGHKLQEAMAPTDARKMPYKIKKEEIKKVLFGLFGEDFVVKCIARQMLNPAQSIYLGTTGFSDAKAGQRFAPMEVNVLLPKTEIEVLLKFDPDSWNPFPVVRPPEAKRYLVQIDDPKKHGPITLVKNWTFSQTWRKLGVVAFRELPAPYETPKQEDEEVW